MRISALARNMFAARLRTGPAVAGAIAVVVSLVAGVAGAGTVVYNPAKFNKAGNILIADQYNNRVIEIDPQGNIVWQWGNGPTDFTAASIVGVNDAQRFGHFTLMAGTGIPAGAAPNCTDPNGCMDNRVIIVDHLGNVRFQYGKFGVAGAAFNELNAPVQATFLPNSCVLITDQGNQRVIEVEPRKHIVWQYGTTGVTGDGANMLNNPNSAELLQNGYVLIADEGNNRVIEVRPDHAIVATFTAHGTISGAAFASRLPNGNTLISDAGNNRIVEVDKRDNVVWQYFTDTEAGSNPAPTPTRAIRLVNGNTIISDQNNHRVIVVDPNGNTVATYGTLNTSGYGTHTAGEGLNGPYDAKMLGDYNGITPPFTDHMEITPQFTGHIADVDDNL